MQLTQLSKLAKPVTKAFTGYTGPIIEKIKGLEFAGFKRQLDYLENNYKIIEAQKLLDFTTDGKDFPKNSCLLTFDDGYKDHIEYVLPELLKRKINFLINFHRTRFQDNKIELDTENLFTELKKINKIITKI